MSGPDARAVAAEVGRAVGAEDLAESILAGQLTARTAAPLLAGMLDGLVHEVVLPIIAAPRWETFDPSVPAPVGVLHLADGSQLRIILDPMDGPQWTPGRWWRVLDSSGEVWAETSSEDEARAALRETEGGVLERLYDRASEAEWRSVR